MACPYGAIIFRPETAAEKCDLCRDQDEPACVRACPTKALSYCEPGEFKKKISAERKRTKPAIP
jgi:carbon-monoxide dehydrogenase iron sulfur subunit